MATPGAWRKTLGPIRDQFLALSGGEPRLHHVLRTCRGESIEVKGADDAMTSVLQRRGAGFSVARAQSGIAHEPETRTTADGDCVFEKGSWYVARWFADGEPHAVARSRERYTALAEQAWSLLPPQARARGKSHWFDLRGHEGAEMWTLWLYGVAWGSNDPLGFSANRFIGGEARAHQVTVEIESLVRLPERVPQIEASDDTPADVLAAFPPRPRAEVVEERLRQMTCSAPELLAQWGAFGAPPVSFFARIEPDLALASALAIDHILRAPLAILEEHPGWRGVGPGTFMGYPTPDGPLAPILDDGAGYVALAFDRPHGNSLTDFAWVGLEFLARTGTPALDRIIDLARGVGEQAKFARENQQDPRSGRIGGRNRPLLGALIVDETWCERVTQFGCSSDSAYQYPLSAFGRVHYLWPLLRRRAAAALKGAPPSLALPAISRLVARDTSPVEWTDTELKDLEEMRGEVFRLAAASAGKAAKASRPPKKKALSVQAKARMEADILNQRKDAVALAETLGIRKAARELKIPSSTLSDWKSAERATYSLERPQRDDD